MRPNIALDMDGVVCNFSEPFRAWAKSMYDLTWTESDKFNWDSDQGLPEKASHRIMAEFIREESHMMNTLWDGAELVRYLWNKTGRPITFITARNFSTIGATHGWVRANFPEIDFIVITVESGSSKWRYLDDFDCFIDDRRKTCIDLAASGKIVFMPARSYNTLRDEDAFAEMCRKGVSVSYVESEILPKDIVLLKHSSDICNGNFDHLIFKS